MVQSRTKIKLSHKSGGGLSKHQKHLIATNLTRPYLSNINRPLHETKVTANDHSRIVNIFTVCCAFFPRLHPKLRLCPLNAAALPVATIPSNRLFDSSLFINTTISPSDTTPEKSLSSLSLHFLVNTQFLHDFNVSTSSTCPYYHYPPFYSDSHLRSPVKHAQIDCLRPK